MFTGLTTTNNDLDPETTVLRKTAVIDAEMTQQHDDIAALQETRLAGVGIIKEAEYTFFWFGKEPDESRIYGTGFAVANRLICSTELPYAISDRISVINMNTKQGNLRIKNAYAPALAGSPADKDNFYFQLEDTIRKASCLERTVLLGDINARTRADFESWLECLGRFGVGKVNENGERLLELRSRNNLCVTNTMFPGKPHRKVFWNHPHSKTWHQLDFVIISRKR